MLGHVLSSWSCCIHNLNQEEKQVLAHSFQSQLRAKRKSSQSAPECSFLLGKSPTKNTFFYHPETWSQKTVSVIPFRVALTLDVELNGLVFRWLFVSTNGIKMLILCVAGFKSSTLTDYCSNSWFVYQKLNTYSALFLLCWLSHLSWFQGLKYMQPSFWPQVTNHDVNSKNLNKWFLWYCSCTQLFHDVEKMGRKPKTSVRVIQRFWHVHNIG